jgi:hypothetical protein
MIQNIVEKAKKQESDTTYSGLKEYFLLIHYKAPNEVAKIGIPKSDTRYSVDKV